MWRPEREKGKKTLDFRLLNGTERRSLAYRKKRKSNEITRRACECASIENQCGRMTATKALEIGFRVFGLLTNGVWRVVETTEMWRSRRTKRTTGEKMLNVVEETPNSMETIENRQRQTIWGGVHNKTSGRMALHYSHWKNGRSSPQIVHRSIIKIHGCRSLKKTAQTIDWSIGKE